jgi:hypothetical protein
MSKVSSGVTEVDSRSGAERLLETDVDPELERQLALAADDETVEAGSYYGKTACAGSVHPIPRRCCGASIATSRPAPSNAPFCRDSAC